MNPVVADIADALGPAAKHRVWQVLPADRTADGAYVVTDLPEQP